MICTKLFEPPEWNRREILRYAGIRGADDHCRSLLEECIREAEPVLSYRVCYTDLAVSRENDHLRLGYLITRSKTIAAAIKDADKVLLFAATVGAPFDRMIQKYSKLSPSKALMLQAIGAERVESLCDAFCAEIDHDLIASQKKLRTRVSPGYGDIPLSMQRDIFALLDCPRKIGLTLDESLMMSPSKSVTALCGIVDRTADPVCEHCCSACDKTDCAYRTERDI